MGRAVLRSFHSLGGRLNSRDTLLGASRIRPALGGNSYRQRIVLTPDWLSMAAWASERKPPAGSAGLCAL